MLIPALPTPAGSHPVGVAALYLQGVSRPDPWVREVPMRELMVSVWYRAALTSGPRARYLTPTESSYVLAGRGDVSVAIDRTYETASTTFPDGREGRYSPGDGPAADTRARDRSLLTGSKRWLAAPGTGHPYSVGLGLPADQLGLPLGAGDERAGCSLRRTPARSPRSGEDQLIAQSWSVDPVSACCVTRAPFAVEDVVMSSPLSADVTL
ncbi:hypothetical protein ACFVIY_41700 [Streptomyces sp. NPDC127166]|uniref:hypothetical protein n=1 Tax=Streptomyces sp. NPDC127166 TaxID=3345380 RepID=UPI003644EBAF